MEKISTGTLMRRLIKTKHLDTFLESNEKFMQPRELKEELKELCGKRGMIPERVILKAGLDRTYGHQIFNGTRRPSRDKILQLALGLELSVEEAQNLLRAAGKSPLYPKLKRDSVILYCLKEKMTMLETQEILAGYRLSLLGEN